MLAGREVPLRVLRIRLVPVAIPAQAAEENARFGVARRPGGREEEPVVQPLPIRRAALAQHARRVQPRRLDIRRVVHQVEGLDRGVRPHLAHLAGLARGGVEGEHRRRPQGALPERVQAALVERLSVVVLVSAPVRELLPQARGLVWFDGRPAGLGREQARDRQGPDRESIPREAAPWERAP